VLTQIICSKNRNISYFLREKMSESWEQANIYLKGATIVGITAVGMFGIIATVAGVCELLGVTKKDVLKPTHTKKIKKNKLIRVECEDMDDMEYNLTVADITARLEKNPANVITITGKCKNSNGYRKVYIRVRDPKDGCCGPRGPTS
jgi:hypothetical protein